jgi:hypothetical protein
MGSKQSNPVSVLDPVNSLHKLLTPSVDEGYRTESTPIDCALDVYKARLIHTRQELHNLFSGCTPLDNRLIHQYLNKPSTADQMMLDAWAKCGRNDQERTVDLRIGDTARRTMTPLGLACLIRYARAWIDAAENAILNASIPGGSSNRSPGAKRKSPQEGQQPRRHARPTAKRKK